MADEQVTSQEAVNSTPATDSAPIVEQGTQANPPAAENVASDKGSVENRIPQSRFNQVVEQRNREREMRESYEAQIRELKSRQSAPVQDNGSNSVVETQVKRLMQKLDLKEDAAREIVMANREVAKAERQQVEMQMAQQFQRMQLGQWQEELSTKHKDYREVEPKMSEIWDTMSPQEQALAVSSKRGLEMLYGYAKAQAADSLIEKARNDAASQVYSNKLTKQSVSSTPGASSAKPNSGLSAKAIGEMSSEEYQRRLPEINAWLSSRK